MKIKKNYNTIIKWNSIVHHEMEAKNKWKKVLQMQNETCSEATKWITQLCFISGSWALEEKYFFFLEQVRIKKTNET